MGRLTRRRGYWDIIIGVALGLLGALTMVILALETNHVRFGVNVMTEDPQLVNAIYMVKNLEMYVARMGDDAVRAYFQEGGPRFCGRMGVGVLDISIWRNGTCDYASLTGENLTGSRKAFVEEVMQKTSNWAMQRYGSLWRVNIRFDGNRLVLYRESRDVMPGRPKVEATLGSEIDMEWNDADMEATLLKARSENPGEELPEVPGCLIHSGTLEYRDTDYEFSMIYCE